MENIYQSKNNCTYVISENTNINLLDTLGVYQGAKVVKTHSYKFGGPVLLEIDGRSIAIGKKIALNIKVIKGEE